MPTKKQIKDTDTSSHKVDSKKEIKEQPVSAKETTVPVSEIKEEVKLIEEAPTAVSLPTPPAINLPKFTSSSSNSNNNVSQSSYTNANSQNMTQRRNMRQSSNNRGQNSQGGGYVRNNNNGSNGYSNGSNYNNNSNSNYQNYQNNQNQGYQQGYTQNVDATNYTGDVIAISGLLEILPDYGVIRQENHPYDNPDLPKDVYISQSQIRRFALRSGDLVNGFARPPKEGERYLSLLRVEKVEGLEPEEARKRPQFTKLTPIFPNKWLKLETTSDIISTRLIDLVAPIGKGQRAMIVAPPKAGKTWLLKEIANGITTNFPEVALLVALIGERPEEVTHFSRSVKGEVFASNFDEKADQQTAIAEICLERAKRMAEKGQDVVILMDSLTRLARAYNMVAPPSGRTLTGGFDPAALYPAKHFFGAARNLEEGGSLTIIATALVDTGSRMDDVIFEEFKGTGNMELRLDRSLSERRIFPSIDIKASGTRHEEYLLDKSELDKVFRLRRMADLLDDRSSTELVIDRLKKSKSNKEFLDNLNKAN